LNQLLNTGKSIGNPRWRNQCNSYWRQPKNNESSDCAILASKLEGQTPVELFEEFLDSSILNLIVDQSNLYSAQKNSDFRLDVPILKRFLSILLFSGAPTEKMYRFTSPDITISIVRNTLSRSHYLKVKSALHLADNDKVDSKDKLYKVRRFLYAVSDNCAKFGVFTHALSIDESMWPYHGRHGYKMFIKG
jgi:hypothetical protein